MSERDDRRDDRRYQDAVTFKGRRRRCRITVPRLPWRDKEPGTDNKPAGDR